MLCTLHGLNYGDRVHLSIHGRNGTPTPVGVKQVGGEIKFTIINPDNNYTGPATIMQVTNGSPLFSAHGPVRSGDRCCFQFPVGMSPTVIIETDQATTTMPCTIDTDGAATLYLTPSK